MTKIKIKTHKGAVKRLGITKGGKAKRRKAAQSHYLEKKSATRKRTYRKTQDVAKSDVRRVRKLLNR